MKSVFNLSLIAIANELCVTFSVKIDHNVPPHYTYMKYFLYSVAYLRRLLLSNDSVNKSQQRNFFL
jgi:hypothetical protein